MAHLILTQARAEIGMMKPEAQQLLDAGMSRAIVVLDAFDGADVDREERGELPLREPQAASKSLPVVHAGMKRYHGRYSHHIPPLSSSKVAFAPSLVSFSAACDCISRFARRSRTWGA